MAYQRAQWKSGLTYRQVCDSCRKTFEYTDDALDFRPWYADGYVDCPVCGSHLRHNERFAINAPGQPMVVPAVQETLAFTEAFCHQCGNRFGEGHSFCCKCGTKRQ